MPNFSRRVLRNPETSPARVVLREARRLHRAALSDALPESLPVLRRVLAAGAVPAFSLPNLFRLRHTVQRKHILRTLAVEAGHATWEAYARVLPSLDAQALEQVFLAQRSPSSLRLWFSTNTEAAEYAQAHGGQAVRVGLQAVVVPAVH